MSFILKIFLMDLVIYFTNLKDRMNNMGLKIYLHPSDNSSAIIIKHVNEQTLKFSNN
jgi:hypothetical protein